MSGKSQKNLPTSCVRPCIQSGLSISAEVAANFKAWYERNFVNHLAGRIGNISYDRAGALDDHPGDGAWYADAYERALLDHSEPLQGDELAFLLKNPLVALQLAVGITDVRGLRCLRRGLTQGINRLQAKSYRSRYYARDNARRRRLAAERRRITRRRTLNPCPTPEAFREAFMHRADSVDARIFFGGLVHDLECYVDNCLKFNDNGEIVGRNGGVKAWIAANVPELYERYKTIMRYKSLAKRVRQAAEIKDPVPTNVLLPIAEMLETPNSTASDETTAQKRRKNDASGDDKIYYAVKSHIPVRERVLLEEPNHAGKANEAGHYAGKADETRHCAGKANEAGHYAGNGKMENARKLLATALIGCANTMKDLFDRLE